MKLFAKKPCSFNGKNYFIGDEIPIESVLDPKAQQMMGVIEVVEENSGSRVESEPADSNEGGPLLPPSSTLEKDDLPAVNAVKGVKKTANKSADTAKTAKKKG